MGYIIDFLIYSLYEKYREKITKIFEYLSDDDIYKTCLYFIEDKKGQTGLEIFEFVNDKPSKIKDLVENIIKNNVVIENVLIKKIIIEYENLSQFNKSAILNSIIKYLGKSNRINDHVYVLDNLIQAATTIYSAYDRSNALSNIASALSQYPNQLDKASQSSMKQFKLPLQ